MQRANDNSNQTVAEMRQTVQLLAQRINQLERMLNGKEIRESKVENGQTYDRVARLSLSNGMTNSDWNKTTAVFPSSMPPETGDYVLTSQAGVVSWVLLETFACPI